MSTPRMLILMLAAAVVGSALGAVYARHESRKLFVELQDLTAVRDEMNIEWGQLQLEQSTWATHGRVEELARSKLQMLTPLPEDIYIVTPRTQGQQP